MMHRYLAADYPSLYPAYTVLKDPNDPTSGYVLLASVWSGDAVEAKNMMPFGKASKPEPHTIIPEWVMHHVQPHRPHESMN